MYATSPSDEGDGAVAGTSGFCRFAGSRRLHRSQKARPNPALEAGMSLPTRLRESFQKNLIGKPIDDIDDYYSNGQTFVVIGSNWIIHRFDADYSLALMPPNSLVRHGMITTVTNSLFQYFMLFVLLIYTISFYEIFGHRSPLVVSLLVYPVFAIEVVMKVIAHGFIVKPFAYLRQPWNWIDFIPTTVGLVFLLLDKWVLFNCVSVIRIFRLLTFFTYSRLVFSSSVSALFKMKDIFVYAASLFFIFTVFAVNVFGMVLDHRCVKILEETDALNETHHRDNFSDYSFSDDYLYSGASCKDSSHVSGCPPGYACLKLPGSLFDFNNFTSASVSIIRLMTRDKWEESLNQVETHFGSHACILFFVTVIVFGSYLLNNLIVAHLAVYYGQLMEVLDESKKIKTTEKDTVTAEDGSKIADVTETEKSDTDDVTFEDTIFTKYKSESVIMEETAVEIISKRDLPNVESSETDKVDTEVPISKVQSENPWTNCCSSCLNIFCSWKCCLCCIKMQESLSKIVLHRRFEFFISAIIVVNVLAMALDHHNMSLRLYNVISLIHFISFLVYFVEAILKILALSPNRYFRDSWCIFEFCIVLSTILDYIIMDMFGLVFLRIIFLCRLFRLAKFYHHLHTLFKLCTVDTFALLFFVFTFAALILQIFQSGAVDANMFYRQEFKQCLATDFSQSTFFIFRIIFGNWIDCAMSPPLLAEVKELWFLLIFVTLLFSYLLIFNIFISMLMLLIGSHNLCDFDTEIQNEGESVFTVLGRFIMKVCLFPFNCRRNTFSSAKSEEQLFEVFLEGDTTKETHTTNSDDENMAEQCCPPFCYSCLPFCGTSTAVPVVSSSNKFWSTWQIFRNKLLALQGNTFFRSTFSFFVITTSVLQLSFDDEKYKNPPRYVNQLDLLVFIVFFMELLMKLLGLGCRRYFSTGWNRFDFIVTFLQLVGFVCQVLQVSHFFVVFSSFRVLKLFSYHNRLQVMVEAIFDHFSIILNSFFACFFVWLLFAITGVQWYAGKFYFCSDLQGNVLPTLDKKECQTLNLTLLNSYINFDNVPIAVVALLEVTTKSGDVYFTHDRYINMKSFVTGIYILSFMFIGVLCCFACIVRAHVNKVNIQKKHSGGYVETLMTTSQKANYVNTKKALFNSPLKTLPKPSSLYLMPLYNLVSAKAFSMAIILVLIFNTVVLVAYSTNTHEDNPGTHRIFFIFHLSVILIFLIEVSLKLVVFGASYFYSSWNIYDVFIILLALVDFFLYESAYIIFNIAVINLLLVLRLGRWIKSTRRVFTNLWVSHSVFLNAAFLFAILMFFYSRIGVYLFYHNSLYNNVVTDQFYTFGNSVAALSVMFKMTFFAAWDIIYLGLNPHACHDPDLCSGMGWISLFILSYLFISFLILVHVGTVLFMEHYERLRRKVRLGITDEDLDDFTNKWHVFDPSGSGYISSESLAQFMSSLVPIFKSDQPSDELDVPVSEENRLSFADVLQALLRRLDVNHEFYNDHQSEA